jgi:hypothetical protein
MSNPARKSIEKESTKPANRYSYPQLAFKLPALTPGQKSIGEGGQYSTGANNDAIWEEFRTEWAGVVTLILCICCLTTWIQPMCRKSRE